MLAVGGWLALRVVALAPDWFVTADSAVAAPAGQTAPTALAPTSAGHPAQLTATAQAAPRPLRAGTTTARPSPPLTTLGRAGTRVRRIGAPILANLGLRTDPGFPDLVPRALPQEPQAVPAAQPRSRRPAASSKPSRWSASAWLFVRDGAAAVGLAPGGLLGGSQGGGRLRYRINDDPRRALALSGRLYLPLDTPGAAEVAFGLDWQPLKQLPLHILAERRQGIGPTGRSDFGATVYGGGEWRLLRGRVRVEAYGQAGVVGIEERDLFADGAVRAGVRLGPVEVGAGAWGGAQPGAARLDIGPQATFRLPVGKLGIRGSAEWRFRVAGDAVPGSGPAFTLATDF